MRKTLTISLPEDMKRDLDAASAEAGLTRSDLVREALQDHLFVRRFRALRAQMMAKAQAKGVFTDEDVFEQVS